jgi:polysaccharide deacetylase family protein (PEP-CTERM system associated)
MTIDVEDYFQVQAFAHCIEKSSWDGYSCRVEANVDRLLAQFAQAGVVATFFTLGWVGERYRGMVRRIVATGHELASHGYAHVPAHEQDPESFRDDVVRSKALLEDIGGVAVIGYRAPTFSIGRRNPWAFDVLEQAGYRYSSSVYPVRHDLYGTPDAPRTPYRPQDGTLWELPLTTIRLGGRNIPWAGGGYFRILPYGVYRRGLSAFNNREARAAIFYLHPWEIDPGQPRVAGCGLTSRIRHYVNLKHTAGRLERLLRDFAWDRMDAVFADLLGTGATESRPVTS